MYGRHAHECLLQGTCYIKVPAHAHITCWALVSPVNAMPPTVGQRRYGMAGYVSRSRHGKNEHCKVYGCSPKARAPRWAARRADRITLLRTRQACPSSSLISASGTCLTSGTAMTGCAPRTGLPGRPPLQPNAVMGRGPSRTLRLGCCGRAAAITCCCCCERGLELGVVKPYAGRRRASSARPRSRMPSSR